MNGAITLLPNVLMVCTEKTLPLLIFTIDVCTWYGLRLPEADSVRPGSNSGVFSTTLFVRSERIRQVLLLTSFLLCWCELIVRVVCSAVPSQQRRKNCIQNTRQWRKERNIAACSGGFLTRTQSPLNNTINLRALNTFVLDKGLIELYIYIYIYIPK